MFSKRRNKDLDLRGKKLKNAVVDYLRQEGDDEDNAVMISASLGNIIKEVINTLSILKRD